MPHLPDDLPRRNARVRRRDGDEDIAAGPPRQIREPAAHRAGAVVGVTRIVHRRHHGHDVDRDVDAAGDSRDFRRRQPALRIDAVGDDDDGGALRQPAFARRRCRDDLGRLGDGVVKRRLPKRLLDLVDLALQPLEVAGEAGDLLELGVEREHRGFIARLQRAEDVPRRLLGVDRLGPHPHAATDVKEHRDPNRPVRFLVEPDNRAPLASLDDGEVVAGEIRHEPAFLVAHHRGHGNQVDRRLEPDRRFLCRRLRRSDRRRRRWCLRHRGSGPEDRGRYG